MGHDHGLVRRALITMPQTDQSGGGDLIRGHSLSATINRVTCDVLWVHVSLSFSLSKLSLTLFSFCSILLATINGAGVETLRLSVLWLFLM
jgi:hypothetical protein